MNLSVVIPTLNEAGQVAEALRSARAPGVEIIVVDGGSGDGTPDIAAAVGARVVETPPGRARQLEVGARESRGEVILFLHADTRLPEGYVGCVADALRDPDVVGGAFRFRFERDSEPLSALERAGLWLVEGGTRLRGALLGLPYGDQALFVRRRVLAAVGGVPQVPIMEDLDLVRSLRRAGRLALLAAPATTSPRRHRAGGPLRVSCRHALLALGFWLGVDRARLALWSRR